MKKTAIKLAETRRDVPQGLGLVRNSTKRQDIERQHADLDWLEIRYGVQISKRLIIEGLSGASTLNDPDVKRILSELADPQQTFLGTSAIDRLVRPGQEDFLSYGIFQTFAALHRPIYSKREGFVEPWTPEGHEVCVEAAKKARSERLELRRRSMDEKLVLAKQNVQCSATAAYGYRHVSRKRKGCWIIVEAEAEVVRRMYRFAAELGWTGYKIAKWLNKEGEFKDRQGSAIPTARGGKWSAKVVRQTLYNPCYVGKARFASGKTHETSILIPAILTGAQTAWWDAVQVSRTRNQETRRGRPSSNYLFQTLIFCGCPICRSQKRITGRRIRKTHRVYVAVHPPQISCELLDNAIWKALIDALRQTDTVNDMLEALREKHRQTRPLGPDKTEQLAKLKRDETAVRKTLGDGDLISLWAENKKRLLAIQSEIATLERELSRSCNVFEMPSMLSVKAFTREIEEAGEWTEYTHRRGLVDRLVEKVVYYNREFEVRGRMVFASEPIKSGVQKWDRGIGADPIFAPFVIRGRIAA